MSETGKGVIACAVVALLIAITAYFYLSPPNERTVSFTTKDAISLRGGEDVRVAGVSVGTVKSLTYADDHITVAMSVKSSVHIGDLTRVDVRLLTAVGGYFVTLTPLGRDQSGNEIEIPRDRVQVPYTIADTIQALPRVTDNVSGVPIDRILAQMGDGLGSHPDAVRSIVAGMQSLATVIDQQKQQVTSTLDLVREYSATFDQSRAFLFALVNKVNVVLSQYYIYRAQFSEAFVQMGGVLKKLGNFAQFYVDHSDQLYALVNKVREGAKQLRDGTDSLIAGLVPLQQRLNQFTATLGAGSESSTSPAPTICLPIKGKDC
ncbi:MlaD family protein [Gordonia polyisoprenivorans]|uniref:MlaD family protein n=1 Tax=Gordonia polyisoprenivorans TaxID=84595 RepID=UPI001AD67D22|nr:MlaD family protein [Gordonia polyisoprenivorans]QTI68987.1 MCE family protein [Gordonia polyisoprenivorans]